MSDPRPTTDLFIGTSEGLFGLAGGDPRPDPSFGPREVSALAVRDGGVWAVAERRVIARRDREGAWVDVARSDEFDLACLAPTSHGVFAGTDEAHLLRLVGDDGPLAPVEAFGTVEGRETWFTPWGGPPAVRSIAQDLAGRLHANVHVGGIPRSVDAGASWEPTIDIDADVHQVVAHPTEPDVVLAAGAVGLAVSVDGGSSWRIEREGLHATYARAVAVAGDRVLLSVSNGPRGGRARSTGPRSNRVPRSSAAPRGCPSGSTATSTPAGSTREDPRSRSARETVRSSSRTTRADAGRAPPPASRRSGPSASSESTRGQDPATRSGSGRTPFPAPPNRSRCAGSRGRPTHPSAGARRGSSGSRS